MKLLSTSGYRRGAVMLTTGLLTGMLPLTAAIAHNDGSTAHHPEASIAATPNDEVGLGSSITVSSTISDKHRTEYRYSVGTVTLEWKKGGPDYTTIGTPGTPDATGTYSQQLAVTEAAGFAIGDLIQVRARYSGPAGSDQSSVIEDILVVENPCDDGLVHLSNPAITGTGVPAPGSTHNWAVSLQVKNCTGEDLTGVKVQGGSSGWTTTGVATATSLPAPTQKANKNNTVTTWTGALADQAAVTITVPVSGTVSTVCDAVQFLSGNWSAAYKLAGVSYKTDYTSRASVTVTCPAE